MARNAVGQLSKGGFHKALGYIFPVRKEIGEVYDEFRGHISRKIRFDLGIYSLSSLGSFGLHSAGRLEAYASGVIVMQMAKDVQKLIWLNLGERCYDMEIKLGEARAPGLEEAEVLERKDYSHVTQDMIQETLPKFVGRITHKNLHLSTPEGIINERPAICHEIQLRKFEPPIIGLTIRCGARFHPRYFVSDFASELGTVAHARRLHRFAQGPYTYEEALPSYAISSENCKKASEKYAERLRAYNHSIRQCFPKDEIKLYVSQKQAYRFVGYPEDRKQWLQSQKSENERSAQVESA